MTIFADTTPATKASSSQGEASLLATVPATLTAAGYSPDTITQVKQMIAGGLVYSTFASQVAAQNNRDLLPVTAMLDEIITRVASNQALKPLVDLIKRDQIDPPAEPGHYPFCFGKCVLQRFDDGDTYVEHYGPTVDVTIDDPRGGTIRLRAEVGSDENLVDERPTVFMHSDDEDGLMFNAAQLDQAIAQFDAFVDGLRQLRRLMVQEKAK
ncbi:DUF6907 domain-containing protein [Streptomyces sp. NPDC059175]|uniref:DUF6907 domain-containing protein n=1 Tax=Streptomyces sp. NPDC059175 TaxID=3346757 RepID=UPI0036B5837E